MSVVIQPDQAAVAQAKSTLVCAAAEVDLLEPVRRRPFACIGVAAAAGVILGMSTRRLAATARLSRAIAFAIRSIASGRHAAAKPASHRSLT